MEEIQDQIAICVKTNFKRISNEYQTNFKPIANKFQMNLKQRKVQIEMGNKSLNMKGK